MKPRKNPAPAPRNPFPKPRFIPLCPPRLWPATKKPVHQPMTLCQRYTPGLGLRLGMEYMAAGNPNPPEPPITTDMVFTAPDGLTVFTTPDDTTVFTAP